MAIRNVDILFTPEWDVYGQWYSVLSIVMKNNTGKALDDPEIKIELGQPATGTQDVGYFFEQDGIFLTGSLAPNLLPVEAGSSVTFKIGLNFSSGFDGSFPANYWVDGVLAEGGGGGGELDDEPPSQPKSLKETSVTDTTIGIAWDASTDNVGVDHYVVHYSAGSSGSQQTVSNTQALLSGLKPETSYKIYVVAVDKAGNNSTKSSEISVTTKTKVVDNEPPTVPSNLQTENITSTSITVKWNASKDNVAVTGYIVQYTEKGGQAKTLDSQTNSATLSGLKPETDYSIKVLAYDGSNNKSAYSNTLNVTTAEGGNATVPYAPYVDVTLFANWSSTPPSINTDFVKDALALGVKKFHLAFVVYDRTTQDIVWGTSYFPLNSIKNTVDLINKGGAEAIFAFGGFSGLDPSVELSVSDLTKLYVDIAKTYGVRHIDFDFETFGLYDYSVAFPAALAAKKQVPDLHFSLTLPVMPSGLVAEGLTMIKDAKNRGLDVSVQIMAMDYGQSNSDMGKAAVQAAISTKDQLAKIYPEKSEAELFSLIGVTPMLGRNDTAPETFFLTDIPTLTDFAKANGIALIGAWSLARDFPAGMDSHGNSHSELSTCAQEPNQTEEYEFLTTFLKHLS